ncbi:MAG TPA: carbohydrate ABC transporter permease [Devosiaceae bacterium]|jgi:multiple sugar transport system permease protein|nr:carbohydrate ABC transporter permease [Devosiaceae bacterium]
MTALVSEQQLGETRKLKAGDLARRFLRIAFLLLATFIFFVPILGSALTAVRTVGDILNNGAWALPQPFQPDNFLAAWRGLWPYFRASVIVTVPSIVGVLLIASMASYAISRLRFPGRLPIFFTLIALSFVPIQVQLIPIFKLFNAIGLFDTFYALIIVQIMRHVPFAVLVMTGFFNTVPSELREAAKVDGASEWTVYWRIFLPLARPALAALLVLEFTWIWNDLLWGLVLAQSNDKRPVTVGILTFQGEHTLSWPLIAAGAVTAALPTVLVFLMFQKHFIRGMTMGAVKG